MTSSGEVTVRVPAKVNLELRVGGPRPDGYHELATVFQAIALFDDLTAVEADEISITVEGAYLAGVPTGPDNLAVRAARLLAERAGIDAGARLHLRKGIPVAGGMAGGSADAAAALLACHALWRAGLSRDELSELAAELCSDVPFGLLGGTAIGTIISGGGFEQVGFGAKTIGTIVSSGGEEDVQSGGTASGTIISWIEQVVAPCRLCQRRCPGSSTISVAPTISALTGSQGAMA